MSLVGLNVYDFPRDFLSLNQCQIEPNPKAAYTKKILEFEEKQIDNTSKLSKISAPF